MNQDFESKSLTFQTAAGVDELIQELDDSPEFVKVNGGYNRLHEVKAVYGAGLLMTEKDPQAPKQGAFQRLTGKKKIDANPLEKVFAINQAFNGFGQFGYYVQTDQRLYFHQCESPIDLHIDFATLQNLGVDAQGNTLDIFSQPPFSPQPLPDSGLSCVFQFPQTSQPPLTDVGHKGVDYVIIKVTPQNPLTDARFRTRLISLNSGTPYDNIEVGYYHTQNACRQDSEPLALGPDGFPGYPPDNTKTAYMGWGGDVLVNTWTAHSDPVNQIWTQVGDAWATINAPTKTQIYPDNYIAQTISGNPPAPSTTGHRCLGGITPGLRYFFTGDNTVRVANSTSTINCPFGLEVGNSILTVNYNFLPVSASQGQTAISGNIIYTYDQGAWVKPYTLSYNVDVTYSNAAARQGDNAFMSNAGNLNKRAHQTDNNTYWVIQKIASWTYADVATLQNSSHTSGDVNKFAKINSPYAWYTLTQAGVAVNATWSYADQAARQSAYGFQASDVGKIAHQLDQDSYWTLSDFNRHSVKTDPSEYFFINYFRLFQDYQSITPLSIQYKLRGYWDKAHGGNGQVRIDVSSFKGGFLQRSDSVVWGNSGGVASGRSGDDGFIADDNRARAGNDGQISNDGTSRSGLDGQTVSTAGRSDTALVVPNDTHLYAKRNGVTYGGDFVAGDVNRVISGQDIASGTTITDIFNDGTNSYAVLSHAAGPKLKGAITVTWTTQSGISNHYISPGQAVFTNADLNHVFQGQNIPNSTTILSIVSATEVILSNPPTAVGTQLSWTIVATVNNKFTSPSQAVFSNLDLNHVIQGKNIPLGTTIITVLDSQNVLLSQPASATGTGLAWNVLSGPSTNFHSDTAVFIIGDNGKLINGDGIAPNTTITFVDSKNVTLSQMPLASGANLHWSIQTAPQSSTKTVTVVAANVDAKGKDFAIVTLSLADGVINITDPSSPNSDADAQTPCPF